MKGKRENKDESRYLPCVEELASLVARLEPGDRELLEELARKVAGLPVEDLPRHQARRLANLEKILARMLSGELSFEKGYRHLVQCVESLQGGCERQGGDNAGPSCLSNEEAEYQEMLIGVFCELIRDMEGKDPHLIAYCKRSVKKIEDHDGVSPELQEHLNGVALLLDYLNEDKIEFDEAHRLMLNIIVQMEQVTCGIRETARADSDRSGEGPPAAADAAKETPEAEPAGEPEEVPGADHGIVPEDVDLDELKDFLEEAPEFIQGSEAALLELENRPEDLELLYEAFRGFHNIKGSASFLCLEDVVKLTHACESILANARDGKESLDRAEVTRLLEAVDVLRELVEAIGEAGAGSPYRLPPRLDEFVQSLEGRSTAPFSRMVRPDEGPAAESEPGPETEVTPGPEMEVTPGPEMDTGASKENGKKGSDAFIRVDTDRLDNLIDAVGELVIAQAILVQGVETSDNGHSRFSSTVSQLTKITREVQELAMSMRMVSLKSTFHKMRRLARDLSSRSGVPVSFTFSGEDTEIDRNMVEEINLPLVHMIRNAVDHGIEPAEIRRGLGKPDAGRIHLSGYHEGGVVVISLEDDGKGLDREALLARAISEGLVKGEARLGDDEIDHLAFSKGLSTAREVTDVSGRGMGLDIVRHTVEKLHGRVEIESRPGRGTRFTIRMPLTLAIIEGMVVKVAGEHYVIPSNSILESIQVPRGELSTVLEKGEAINLRGEVVPLYRIHRLFGIDGAIEEPSNAIVIILEEGRGRFALMVDDIIGQQQVVIKSLGDCFSRVGEFSGGAILGSGRVALIINPQGMLQVAHAV